MRQLFDASVYYREQNNPQTKGWKKKGKKKGSQNSKTRKKWAKKENLPVVLFRVLPRTSIEREDALLHNRVTCSGTREAATNARLPKVALCSRAARSPMPTETHRATESTTGEVRTDEFALLITAREESPNGMPPLRYIEGQFRPVQRGGLLIPSAERVSGSSYYTNIHQYTLVNTEAAARATDPHAFASLFRMHRALQRRTSPYIQVYYYPKSPLKKQKKEKSNIVFCSVYV